MTAPRDEAATDRLRRGLVAFRAAQALLLGVHREAKALASLAERERFWASRGEAVEARQRTAAAEVVAAFKVFSAAGLVAGAADRHLITQARRHLAED